MDIRIFVILCMSDITVCLPYTPHISRYNVKLKEVMFISSIINQGSSEQI